MYEIIEIWTEISITYLNNPEIEPEPRKLGNRKPTFVKKAMEKSHDSLCPLCGVKMSNVSVKVGSNKLIALVSHFSNHPSSPCSPPPLPRALAQPGCPHP